MTTNLKLLISDIDVAIFKLTSAFFNRKTTQITFFELSSSLAAAKSILQTYESELQAGKNLSKEGIQLLDECVALAQETLTIYGQEVAA